MTRWAERLLSLAAIAIAACYLAGIAGWRSPGPGRRISSATAGYFHEGKSGDSGIRDPSCQTETCHSAYPHERGPESTFRNMHVGFIECQVCHGKAGAAAWQIEAGGGDRWIIRAGTRQAGGDPHTAFGPSVRCRECHSERGRKRIESGSNRKLHGTFHDPVALRMMEEGSRKWVPDGM